jgi:2-polyprenyl-3-methyl-5-hydroxy-6-metoxy-1,4-benzoquinol methylase
MSELDISKFKLQKYPCPICEGKSNKKLYSIQGFNVVRCRACSMTFINPRICNEHIFDVYRHEYFHRYQDGYNGYESIADLRIQTFERWYKDIIPYCTKKGVALDIGCAAGYFLDILQDNRWETEGIELDRRMYKLLIQKGYAISNDPLEYFTSSHQYDLITMFDVIEHLPELQKDFAKISSLLSPEGILALSTPNIDSFQHRLLRSRWFQFKPVEHLYYFSFATLKRLAQDNGLCVEVVKKSGQYSNIPFIMDRLEHYGFHNLARLLSFFVNLFGLKKLNWYADTGSIFVVFRKI